MNSEILNILLVDDHHLIISGLGELLRQHFEHVDIKIADDGYQAIEILKNEVVNLLITDWDMPDIGGYQIAEYSVSKGIKTIILTSHTDIVYFLEMESLDVNGILLKNMNDNELLEAIISVCNGKDFRHPVVNEMFDKIDKLPDLSFRLTKREKQQLQYLKDGLLQKEIAAKMFIDIKTVEKHNTNIFRKLQVDSSIQAVLKAIKLGLLRN